jgi:HTH-type transcriptional regulator, sugar sensing transcriptional regulator
MKNFKKEESLLLENKESIGGLKMIVNKFFIDKLSLFGLNSYESKLWAALLSRGVATAGELSEIANVPRSRCYDVLESLEKKGFIISKIGKPLKYIAVPPEEVVDRVKKTLVERAETDTQKLESIRQTDLMDELRLLFKNGVEKVDPEDLSGLLRGRKNIYNQLASIIKEAEKSVSIMTTSSGLLRKFEKLLKEIKFAKDKSVQIKIAAPLCSKHTKLLSELSGIAEVKHTDAKSRFVIVDGKQMVFMVTDDENVNPGYDLGIWVNSPYFAQSMDSLFNTTWSKLPAKGKLD